MLDTLKPYVDDHVLVPLLLLFGLYLAVRKVIEWRNDAKAFVAHVVEEKVPAMIHKTLSNGIRSVMADVVKEEIAKHEVTEEERFRRVLEESRQSRRRR
jgi:hypothetical protein